MVDDERGSAEMNKTLSGPSFLISRQSLCVDIHDDEVKWLKTQPEGQLMDVDGSEVGPSCFALDLEISHLTASRLWIRRDYIQIYDVCKKTYDRP